MAKNAWLAGLLVGLSIGLSGLTGIALGMWWATPAPLPAGTQVAMPTKLLPPAPGSAYRVQAPRVHAPIVLD
jgi:hypothetical protein